MGRFALKDQLKYFDSDGGYVTYLGTLLDSFERHFMHSPNTSRHTCFTSLREGYGFRAGEDMTLIVTGKGDRSRKVIVWQRLSICRLGSEL